MSPVPRDLQNVTHRLDRTTSTARPISRASLLYRAIDSISASVHATCPDRRTQVQPDAKSVAVLQVALQILPTAALPFFYLNIYDVDTPDCFTVISEHISLSFLYFYTF